MGNMFKPTSATSPQDYIDQIDEPRKSEIQQLHDFIVKTLPDQKPFIEYGIGYGKYPYKSKSGREGDWYLIGLASQKNYISLYVCATDKNEKYIAEKYKERLPKASIGKSCIRFKKLSDVDLDVIKEVLIEASKFGPMNPS